jgi:glycosyltransferase involved in cell wall biosynthesis
MITTFYPPYHFGGDAMYVYRLSNELARRGHRVTVVHSADAYQILSRAAPKRVLPHEPGVTVRTARFGPAAPLLTYLSGRPGFNRRLLDDVFRDDGFDVIHFHNVSLMGGPGVFSYGSGVKLYTMHEHWLVCPTHVLWKFNREPCRDPSCLRCTLIYKRPPQLWRYTGLLEQQVELIDLFLSPSRFTLEAHRERGFKRPIRHLPPFLSTREAQAVGQQPMRRERPYFLFVGRLERLKGVETLLERFRAYTDADLLVAGEGEHGATLRRMAAESPNIHFMGDVDPAALPPLYAGAVALLVPSVGYEVFPLVILEAFAQGTPVIVNDLGGLTEAVEDSGAGFAYRTQDELLEAIRVLQRDPDRRRELGQNGRDAWQRLWSEDPHLDGYFAAIEEAKGRSRP